MRLDARGRLDLSIPAVSDPSWGTGLSAAIVTLDPAYPFSVQSISNAVRLR